MDTTYISKQLEDLLSALDKKESDCHAVWHGSIAEGKSEAPTTDVDLILSLHEAMNGQQLDLENRLRELNQIKDVFKGKSIEATKATKRLVKKRKTLQISLLVIPKKESRWDIVKNTKRYDFFKNLLDPNHVSSTLRGNKDFFRPDPGLQHCIELMNGVKGIWDEFADLVRRAQIARKEFCKGVYDNAEVARFDALKLLCRSWDGLVGGDNQDNGYMQLREKLMDKYKDKGAAYIFLDRNRVFPRSEVISSSAIIEMHEMSSSFALEELASHLPEPSDRVTGLIKERIDRNIRVYTVELA
jgi:hypothetical protein